MRLFQASNDEEEGREVEKDVVGMEVGEERCSGSADGWRGMLWEWREERAERIEIFCECVRMVLFPLQHCLEMNVTLWNELLWNRRTADTESQVGTERKKRMS